MGIPELQNLSDRDLLITLYSKAESHETAIEGLGKKFDTLVSVIETKIGREEFKDFKKEARDKHDKLDERMDEAEKKIDSHLEVFEAQKGWREVSWKKVVLWIGVVQFIISLLVGFAMSTGNS